MVSTKEKNKSGKEFADAPHQLWAGTGQSLRQIKTNSTWALALELITLQ